MIPAELSALSLKQKSDFIQSPPVRNVTERALFYLKTGYPVHFSGWAGTGKTTLAMHVAAELGRPVILIHGDDEFGSSDLIGGQHGYRATRVVDNFIHSVLKTEENVAKVWVDNRLTTACKFGLTLIYDEFNRSRPEANNVLLGILEERLLELPNSRNGDGYMAVHPEFRAIFTSNPEEYAGVHKTQDALMDRMITLKLSHYDRDTESSIAAAKSGLDREDATRIVDIVRSFRTLGANNYRPTVRGSIMIARIAALRKARVDASDPIFLEICRDVLCTDTLKITHEGEPIGDDRVEELIRQLGPAKIGATEAPKINHGIVPPSNGSGGRKNGSAKKVSARS